MGGVAGGAVVLDGARAGGGVGGSRGEGCGAVVGVGVADVVLGGGGVSGHGGGRAKECDGWEGGCGAGACAGGAGGGGSG